jgi:hypothetical protein
MKRLFFLLTAVLLIAPACSDDNPTTPSLPTDPRFTATLLPANEVPPVSNAEQSGTGTVTITLHITRDAAQTITAATADFQVTLTGFPPGTPITAAHIHNARAGLVGGTTNNLGLAPGEVVLGANGSGTFTKNGITFNSLTHVQNILNDFNGFYFNVHSTLNPGGVARGQLTPMP